MGPGISRSLQWASVAALWDGLGPRSRASPRQGLPVLSLPPGCQRAVAVSGICTCLTTPTRAPLISFGPGGSCSHLDARASGTGSTGICSMEVGHGLPSQGGGMEGAAGGNEGVSLWGPGGKWYHRDGVGGSRRRPRRKPGGSQTPRRGPLKKWPALPPIGVGEVKVSGLPVH